MTSDRVLLAAILPLPHLLHLSRFTNAEIAAFTGNPEHSRAEEAKLPSCRQRRQVTRLESGSLPLLLGFSFCGRRLRVLDLQPMIDTASAVRRSEPFGYDALAPKRAGVLVNDGAIALVMLVERGPGMSAAQ